MKIWRDMLQRGQEGLEAIREAAHSFGLIAIAPSDWPDGAPTWTASNLATVLDDMPDQDLLAEIGDDWAAAVDEWSR